MKKEENIILTISIAAYNVEKYIGECLKSLLVHNLFDKVQIIVVNDGSTDDTGIIVKKIADFYPNIVELVNKENGGWGSTVNKGIELAKGKYFKLLDSDDLFVKKNLTDFVEYLEETEADLVLEPYIEFESENRKHFVVHRLPKQFEADASYVLNSVIDSIDYGMHMMAVKTEILKKNNISILNHCFYTDIQFVLETNCYIKTVSFFRKPVYCYRNGRIGQSCSMDGYVKHYKEHEKVLFYCAKLYEEKNIAVPVKSFANRKLISLAGIHYEIYGSFKNEERRARLKKWDNVLRQKYPDIYKSIERKDILLGRKIGFVFWKEINRIYLPLRKMILGE